MTARTWMLIAGDVRLVVALEDRRYHVTEVARLVADYVAVALAEATGDELHPRLVEARPQPAAAGEVAWPPHGRLEP